MGKEWDTYDKSQFGLKGNEGKNDLKVKKNFKSITKIQVIILFMILVMLGQKKHLEF